MTNLRVQKRLAASVLKCGQRKGESKAQTRRCTGAPLHSDGGNFLEIVAVKRVAYKVNT